MTISVIYLLRKDNSSQSNFLHFCKSLNMYHPGKNLDLHIVFKGFSEVPSIINLLPKGCNVSTVLLDDLAFDINSYYYVAKKNSSDLILFLNSYSVLNGDNWLKKYYDAHVSTGSLLIGATGSYEASDFSLPYFSLSCPVSLVKFFPRVLFRLFNLIKYSHSGKVSFPNPHIRTNAFLISRKLFIRYFQLYGLPKTKNDCHNIESGVISLTQYALAENCNPGLIDKNGVFFDLSRLYLSNTYRANSQEGLLVSDNRTREFSAASFCGKNSLSYDAWGG